MALHVIGEITGSLFELFQKNRRLKRKIASLVNGDPLSIYESDERALLPVDLLMRFLRDEETRRRAIEDKAKTNILGVTLAFSVMFAGVALVSSRAADSGCSIDWLIFVLAPLLVGIFFLLAGGWVALGILRIGEVYVWTLEEETESSSKESKAARILLYIELNQKINYRKANGVVASYSCIRNGIIVLTLVAIVLAVHGLGL